MRRPCPCCYCLFHLGSSMTSRPENDADPEPEPRKGEEALSSGAHAFMIRTWRRKGGEKKYGLNLAALKNSVIPNTCW
ncbi:hypothetical protein VULLAG_LOCUS15993 [Vulpes lagopus]